MSFDLDALKTTAMKNLIKLLISSIAFIGLAACSKDETVSYDWFPFPIEKIEPATIDVASRK